MFPCAVAPCNKTSDFKTKLNSYCREKILHIPWLRKHDFFYIVMEHRKKNECGSLQCKEIYRIRVIESSETQYALIS